MRSLPGFKGRSAKPRRGKRSALFKALLLKKAVSSERGKPYLPATDGRGGGKSRYRTPKGPELSPGNGGLRQKRRSE